MAVRDKAFRASSVTALSWLFAVLDVVAAIAFAVAGAVELTRRTRSRATSSPGEVPRRDTRVRGRPSWRPPLKCQVFSQ